MTWLMDLAERVAADNGNPPPAPTLDAQVATAQTKLTAAQATLQHLQGQVHGLPYNQRVQLNADIAAQKQAVADAEHALNVARDTAASTRIQGRFRQQELERAEAQKQAEAQRVQEMEAEAKQQYKPHYLNAGGRDFESAWPGIWSKMIETRAAEQHAVRQAQMKRGYEL